MEVVDFHTLRLNEIDKQDNPYYSEDECIMLVRSYARSLLHRKIDIIYVPPGVKTTIIDIATFYDHKLATEYCEWLKTHYNK